MTGIDYGNGLTNIDRATDIRYGVIHSGEVGQSWYDGAEANYGEPTCPKCGNEAKESTARQGKDYRCKTCRYSFWSDEAFGDEAQSFTFSDEDYTADQSGNDCDIFVTRSPYYTLAAFCSPCAPGAGYLTSEGDVKAYCFGHDWFEGGKAPYRVFRVSDDTEVMPE